MPETTYLTTDTELTGVADAIRERGGTSESLEYPDGFVSAIRSIPAGGGDEAYNIRVGENVNVVANSYTINPYQIVFRGYVSSSAVYTETGTLYPFINSNSTETGKTFVTGISFNPKDPLYVYAGDTAVTAGSIPDPTKLYTRYSKLDLRYATNCGTSLTAGKAVYIRINDSSTSGNPRQTRIASLLSYSEVVQIFPTITSNYTVYYYMRLGIAVSDHEIDFDEDHTVYRVSYYGTITPWNFDIPYYDYGSYNRALMVNSSGRLYWGNAGVNNPNSYDVKRTYTFDPASGNSSWMPKDGFSESWWYASPWDLYVLTKTALSATSWKYETKITYFGSNWMNYYRGNLSTVVSDYYFSLVNFDFYDDNDSFSWYNYDARPDGNYGNVILKNGEEIPFSVSDGYDGTYSGTLKLTLEYVYDENEQYDDFDLTFTMVCDHNFSNGTLHLSGINCFVFEKSDMLKKLVGGGSSVTVDSALDANSTNPVENRAIYSVIGDVESLLQAI